MHTESLPKLTSINSSCQVITNCIFWQTLSSPISPTSPRYYWFWPFIWKKTHKISQNPSLYNQGVSYFLKYWVQTNQQILFKLNPIIKTTFISLICLNQIFLGKFNKNYIKHNCIIAKIWSFSIKAQQGSVEIGYHSNITADTVTNYFITVYGKYFNLLVYNIHKKR